MSHYTLGYHDQQNQCHEMCEYANDAFEAVRFAREDVPKRIVGRTIVRFLWLQR